MNFMTFIATEVREIMAQLGFRTIEEMIGRTDRLEPRKAITHWKAKGMDFSSLLYSPDAGPEVGRFCQQTQDHGLEKSLDLTSLLALCAPAIERGEKVGVGFGTADELPSAGARPKNLGRAKLGA